MQLARLRVAYDQVRDHDLHNLCLQARSIFEQSLKNRDHQMAQWSADKRAIHSHLWYTAREVVAMLIAILSNPGREKLLECC